MGTCGDIERKRLLGRPRTRTFGHLGLEAKDLVRRHRGEPAEVDADIAVVGGEPVLVEGVGRGAVWVEPDRIALDGLAVFRTRRGQEERVGQAEGGRVAACCVRAGIVASAPGTTDQLEARGDVAPLVRAAHLHLDIHRSSEMREVGRLEEHVAELGVREALVQAHLDGILGQHVRNREVLADIPEELDHRHRFEPLEVVDHDRTARPGEIEEVLQLRVNGLRVAGQRVAVEEVPLRRAARRVADHARATTDQRHRTTAVALEVDQPEDRNEAADVERRAGRIEAVVPGNRPTRSQACLQPIGCGVEHASPAQLIEQTGGAGIERRHRAR